MRKYPQTRPLPQRERGAYATAFIIFIVVLLGFTGLAVDAGRLYVSKSELQNAADSCALAAAAALTGANANQLEQAVAFGQTAGTRNKIGMQETAAYIGADDITFAETLGGTYLSKNSVGSPLNMKYARCTLTESNIRTFLIHIVNLLPGQSIGLQEIQATAVATNSPSTTTCAIPLAVCRNTVDTPDDDVTGNYPGEWLSAREKSGKGKGGGEWESPVGRGAYKWLELPGYPKKKGIVELLQGSGQCNLTENSKVDSYSGVNNDLIEAWNTRFGVYKKNTKPGDIVAVADFTGHSWYPTKYADGSEFKGKEDTPPEKSTLNSVYEEFRSLRRPALAPWNSETPRWVNDGKSPGNYVDADTIRPGTHKAGGDRRLVVAPVVDCERLASPGTNVDILDWACILMLHPMRDPNVWNFVEYRGLASDLRAGCVTSGLPGGGGSGPLIPTLVQ